MLTPPHNPESSGRNGNKRKSSLAAAPGPIPAYAALVLDIEGTLCPISFVHETLFPFVKERLRKYIEKHWSEPAFAAHIDALRRQAEEDSTSGDAKLEAAPRIPEGTGDDTKDAVEANVRWQMSWDRKGGALKSLQGEMWREGYQDGDIKGFVYPDVPPLFKALQQGGTPVFIYSSGSVLGQKLLFQHSNHGDLLPYIKGHYDTAIGSKLEKESYEKILADIGVDGTILFVSDNVKELEAAHAANLLVALAVRPGNAPVDLPYKIGSVEIPFIESCDQLLQPPFVEGSDKRIRIVETVPVRDEEEDLHSDVAASDAVSLAVVSARATIGDDEAMTTRSLEDEGSGSVEEQ